MAEQRIAKLEPCQPDRDYEMCSGPIVMQRSNHLGEQRWQVKWGPMTGGFDNLEDAQKMFDYLEHQHVCKIRPVYLYEVQNMMHLADRDNHSIMGPTRWVVTDEPAISVQQLLALLEQHRTKHSYLACTYDPNEPMRYHHNAIAGFLTEIGGMLEREVG